MGRHLTLTGGAKPQLRKAAARCQTKAKQREFLTVLAETCNVSEACRQSGLNMTVAYRRRRMNAGFRAAWQEAIAIGYQRLEGLLLNRAFNGIEKIVRRRDGSEERIVDYSDALALKLLAMHRETAAAAEIDLPTEDVDEIRERLVRKLQRLKERNAEANADARDTESPGLRDDGPGHGPVGESDGGAATEAD